MSELSRKNIEKFLETASTILIGKKKEIELSLVCALSNGHLLIEDYPGVGKTTMVFLLAKLLGLDLSRIQFTNDLLPADIIGFNIFDKNTGDFKFKKGPIFGEIVLADELNRATPKTQSALLQVMEERHISVEGVDYKMPSPFIVFATQNPFKQLGTFPLPESQLDRFFMSIFLGAPEREAEKKILMRPKIREEIQSLEPIFTVEELALIQNTISNIHVDEKVYDYVLNILQYCRINLQDGHAMSTRGGQDLVTASKARAFVQGRDYVTVDDVQFLAPYIFGHRVGGVHGVKMGIEKMNELLHKIDL
ncbi:ATPase, AAA family [Bacteriovorax sp. BSW11_IV]|uniref:AAA family ATPase n=1 Tax=Bacteriovorax sp. BSW11_IV TaxID=1353529 RepID=UPI000389F94C|nr:MoxR family ATPase [Bacteriovorax sp. BSW11_IV]EQC48972.1 ATPase, AAA family [Bacteriovorax sp. BSW11_IV]